jgi:hypothetical protein
VRESWPSGKRTTASPCWSGDGDGAEELQEPLDALQLVERLKHDEAHHAVGAGAEEEGIRIAEVIGQGEDGATFRHAVGVVDLDAVDDAEDGIDDQHHQGARDDPGDEERSAECHRHQDEELHCRGHLHPEHQLHENEVRDDAAHAVHEVHGGEDARALLRPGAVLHEGI